VHAPSPAPAQPSAGGRLAEVAAALDRIDDEQRARNTRAASAAAAHPAPTKAVPAKSRTAAAEPAPKPKKAPPAPREPVRHWVQLAHGGSANLSGVFERLKDKAPKLLAGRSPWIATGSPNRLVIGPFPSEQAAENFADRLGKEDLTALPWTNDAGQKVEKLSDK
jgi:cell pole-organizing protein PopZ